MQEQEQEPEQGQEQKNGASSKVVRHMITLSTKRKVNCVLVHRNTVNMRLFKDLLNMANF